MAFEIDFERDFDRILREHLVGMGYALDASLSPEEVRLRYLNVRHRSVASRPRQVHRAAGFGCPTELDEGLRQLEEKIANGQTVRPHLSRQLHSSDYSDALLNDWGIYHLHLGTTVEGDGFVQRTGPVLFALFRDQDAYFIDVKEHGSWADRSMVEVVQQNWPHLIAGYRLRGFTGLVWPGGSPPTPEEITRMRRAGINVLQEIDGGVYAPMGGGMATSRMSVNVVMDSDRIVRELRASQEEALGYEQRLRNDLMQEGVTLPDPVPVHLQLREDGMVLAMVGDALAQMEVFQLDTNF